MPLALLLLLGALPAWGDGAGGAPQAPGVQEGMSGEAQGIFAPRADKDSPRVAKSPFTLLTPIRDLLSGPLWLMAHDLDPRVTQLTRIGGKRGITPRPGVAWDSLQEIFVAPGLPQLSAPAAPTGQALVPFRDPAPAFSRNILITRDFSNAPLQTEPHIAVNPKDPEHLLMATIDYNFPNVSAYFSLDGGATWQGPNQPNFLRDDLGAAGDPIVGFDRQGNAYLAFISVGVEEFTVGPAVDFAVVSSIAVARSEDGGRTWAEAVSSARSGFERQLSYDPTGRIRGQVSLSFLDKPWMALGRHPTDPTKDVIYVTYTEFAQRFSIFSIGELPFFGLPVVDTTIRMVRSEDGGKSWSKAVAASPTVRRVYGDRPRAQGEGLSESPALQQAAEEAVGFRRTLQGSQPAVAPDGTLYVTWLDSTDDEAFEGLAEIYVARSKDGGKTFAKPVRTAVFNEPGFASRTSFFRSWGSAFPQMATGPQGEVYVSYVAIPPDKKNDDGDVYVVRSLDQGLTWSRPVRLNDDTTNRFQFFSSIAVDPKGAVHVMWGDMRDDPASTRYHIYYTRSEDKGVTWGFVDPVLNFRTQNARVTDFPSNPNKGFPGGQFIGDYFSITATEKDVYLVWADTRLGEYGPVNQKIGFVRRTAIQSPEVFLNPPAGSGGQPVQLQGFNFQPDTNVFIQVGGVVVSTLRTNDQGRFTAQLFIPVAGKGAHNVQVFDESGNAATSSFFMEFGFDTVREVQRDLTTQVQGLNKTVGALEGQVSKSLAAELQKLRIALETSLAPPTPPASAAPAASPPKGGAAWWLFAVAVAGAALVGSIVALGASRLIRSGKPKQWDTLR
jgi:hypothetical protein